MRARKSEALKSPHGFPCRALRRRLHLPTRLPIRERYGPLCVIGKTVWPVAGIPRGVPLRQDLDLSRGVFPAGFDEVAQNVRRSGSGG